MPKLLRGLSILIGVSLFFNAVRFAFAPAGAAADLGMGLLTGVGASTQIGDIGALFLAASVLIALGQRPGQGRWLLAAAILLGCAALMRTLAGATGHADFAPQFVVPEVVMAGILVAAARKS